jgi:hypothetical protein
MIFYYYKLIGFKKIACACLSASQVHHHGAADQAALNEHTIVSPLLSLLPCMCTRCCDLNVAPLGIGEGKCWSFTSPER